MKQTGRAGAQRERAVREHFRQRGFIAIKVSDSAICDVVAMKQPLVRDTRRLSAVLMVEVKGSARGAFADFPPNERVALIEAARQAGATPLLAWWPPRGELRFYGVDEWPESKGLAA